MKEKTTAAAVKRILSKKNAATARIKKDSAKTIKKATLKAKNCAINYAVQNRQKKETKKSFGQIFQYFKSIFDQKYVKPYKTSYAHTSVKNIDKILRVGKIILIAAFLIYIITSTFIRINNTPIIFRLPFDASVNKIEITDRFGARKDPFTGQEGDFHHGVDFALNWHSSVLSVADGKVTFAGANDSLGNYVMIRHGMLGQTTYTLYGHLSAILVKEGDKVRAGQTIGLEGGEPKKDPNPGSSTGHHLHFAMLDRDEKYIDPLSKLTLK